MSKSSLSEVYGAFVIGFHVDVVMVSLGSETFNRILATSLSWQTPLLTLSQGVPSRGQALVWSLRLGWALVQDHSLGWEWWELVLEERLGLVQQLWITELPILLARQAFLVCSTTHTCGPTITGGGNVTLDFANLNPRKVKVWLCFTIGMDRSQRPQGPIVHFGLCFEGLNGGRIRTSWGQPTGQVFVSRYGNGVLFQTGGWEEGLNCFQREHGRPIGCSYKYGHQCIYLGEVGAEVLSHLAPVITRDLSAHFDVRCLHNHFGQASSRYIAVMGLVKAISVGPRHFPANWTNCWVFSIRIIKCLGLDVSMTSLFQRLLSMKDVSDESLLSTKEAFGYASLWKRCWESITI